MKKLLAEALADRDHAALTAQKTMEECYPPGEGVAWQFDGYRQYGTVVHHGSGCRLYVHNTFTDRKRWIYAERIV